MSDLPLVSAVIASYNMGEYLPKAVQSVLDQTWPNMEVIIVDDGSKDDTLSRIQPFMTDHRVRYFYQENRGQPKAKNAGIGQSRGEFIAFCDADDLWHPKKLELQIPQFEDPEVGVVYSEESYLDEYGRHLERDGYPRRYSGWVTEELVIRNFVSFGTAVIRRACVDRDGAFDETLPMGIDWDMWLRYSLHWKFHFVPDELYLCRVWSGQMSSNYRGRYENAFRILNKFIKANPERLPSTLIDRAWSDMYVGKAMHVAGAERRLFEPLKYLLMALYHDFRYKRVWKALVKLGIRRV